MNESADDGIGCGEGGCGVGMLHQPEAVFAAALEAYVGSNADGRVVAWNPAAEATFGHSRRQACGQLIEQLIIPGRYRAAHRAGMARLVAGEPARVVGQRLHLAALHRDGHEFPIEMTLTATSGPDGLRFHAFAHDITITQRAARFTAVEAAIARGLAEARSTTAAAGRVVDAVGVEMGWPVVEMWLTDGAKQMLTCAARHIEAGRHPGEFAVDVLEYGAGLPGRVCHDAAPEWIPDLGADSTSPRSPAAARAGLHVAVGVPITTAGHTIGALCVYGDRPEDPEDTLTGLLGGLAAQIGQYWERRRAEELTVELAHTKDEFMAMVTHELRNPLAVITSTAAMFEEDLDELSELSGEQQRQYLHTILRNARRLSVMTDDLLDLARLESGHLAIAPTSTDLRLIIEQAVHAVRTATEEKDIAVTVQVPDHLDLHADPSRLQQVADNLLSNAVKYTPTEGAITITASTDDTEQYITWTFADTGIGIPAAERPRLFRRFFRASTALDRHIPGIGLGLVITRSIIERHHGTIALSEHHGPGTTFEIHLPVKAPV
jgi:PAS domain S-box-containing protein